MSASTSIPTPENRKPRGWFRRHIGDPVARVLLARVRGPGAVLEVDGTRATRRIPIMIWPRDGLDYVVGLFGITPWVRDIRAGRTARIVRGGRARAVHLPELSPEETAEYLRWYLATVPGPRAPLFRPGEGDRHAGRGAGPGPAPPGLPDRGGLS